MDWDAIGAIGEIASALAVLVTLIYLAGQIRQSNRIGITDSEAQFRQMAQSTNRSILELADDDPFLIELLKINPDFTPTQRVKALMFARSIGNLWAFADSCYRNRLIDKAAYQASIDDIRVHFNEYPGIKVAFSELVKNYKAEQYEDSEFWREIINRLENSTEEIQ